MREIDKDDMYQSIWDFPENIIDAIELSEKITLKNEYLNVNNIIIAGMGGSAIGGDVVYSLIKNEIKIPFVVNRGYDLPAWANSSTLIICSSYSGNTEETISILEEAKSLGAKVIGITTGGVLESLCKNYSFDFVNIPSGLQPRAALAFSFIPLLYILKKTSLINVEVKNWLESSVDLIKSKREEYSLAKENNPVYQLANKLYNKLPIIYADSGSLETVAVRLKGQICENSKMLCYHNDLPELNHNEIVGWENNSILFDHLFLIWLSDKSDNERVKHRMAITQTILNEKKVDQHVIEMKGNLFQVRFLNMIHYGDWLSYWCAIAHNTDPSPVSNIDRLKKELSKIK